MHPSKRALGTTLRARLAGFPVVAVVGARQTGKSTMARNVGGDDRLYVTLDSLSALDQARRAPMELLGRASRMTLDEVQRVPDLLLALKEEVDQDRSPGRFLLTGSANLLLMARVSESLAGRAIYLNLWPMTRREKLGLGAAGAWSIFFEHEPSTWADALPADPAPGDAWRRLAVEGGYPDPGFNFRDDAARREAWYDGYVQSYLERDLRELAAVHDLPAFQRLMRAVCLRVGGLLNRSDLARDVGLPLTTAQRYLDLMATSYQLVLLPAYSVNRTKRLTKSPKVFWSDCGLALHIAGESEPRGAHLENLVLQDLLVWKELQTGRPQILHWRTQKGAEVDFVIEWRGRVLPVEVKAGRTVTLKGAEPMKVFLEEYGDVAPGGVILYDGDAVFWTAENILAVPWGRVL